VVNIEYGGMPPKPEVQEFELLCSHRDAFNTYGITVGAGGRRFNFELQLFIPPNKKGARLPVVLDGDGCWRFYNDAVINSINERGFIAARFNRTAIVRDVYTEAEARQSPLYRLFPDIDSGTIAGWAWGYHRCIDVLLQLPMVDPEQIAITGHSRGGKTVLLAGATDERVAFIASNGSGAAGAGCWRYIVGDYHDEENPWSEVLSLTLELVPHWLGPAMREYADHEERLPFDQHYLKALIAPRYFIQTEGLQDIVANPKGTHQTLLAAREVYRLLGVPENILSHYRQGDHDHTPEDFGVLLDVMDHRISGKPLDKSLFEDPFPEMERIFDWNCPK
jgi:hypothetical protein